MSSYLSFRMEESPRFEGAPITTPFRLSTVRHYVPLTSGSVRANPVMLDRGDELRGNLSPTAQIVERMEPAGAIGVRAYGNTIVPILHLAGLEMTAQEGAGTNEVQTLSITGSPTGGTFTITHDDLTTVPIPFNATAAQVQRALESLDNVHKDELPCAGGPLPGTPVTITFEGRYAATNVDMLTTVDSLTGGTTPETVVAETTPGAPGAVLDPDGNGIPADAFLWTSTKRTGSTAKSAEVIAAYEESGAFELGQGYGVSQVSLDAAGAFTAEMLGLVAKGMADPGLTPSYDATAVHPMLGRDLIVTWREGVGNVSDFSLQISNPIAAERHFGIRSAYPGKLRYAEGFVTLSGSVSMDEFDPEDRESLLDARLFTGAAHWQSRSKIGDSGAYYNVWIEMPSCQLVGGQGPDDLSARRRHGASFEWQAAYDETEEFDFKVHVLCALEEIEDYE